MQQHHPEALTVGLLSVSRALLDGITAGVRARGFDDLRPAHGFAFTRLAPGGATITELAEHLDVTRQAAAQLVDELVAKGYVQRSRHPDDARARLITLTSKGWAAPGPPRRRWRTPCVRGRPSSASSGCGHSRTICSASRRRAPSG